MKTRRSRVPLLHVFLLAGLGLFFPWMTGRTEPPTAPAEADPPRQVLAEINRARTQPAAYADFLAERRAAFQDKILNLPGQEPLETREGVAPLDEAIAALRALPKPLPALEFDEALAAAAAELATDQFKTGQTGHVGSAGGTMTTRLARQGTVQGQAGENLAYGTASPEEIVFSLMVDDGVAGRGHRGNLLNPEFRRVGIVVGPHPEWETVCVMDFAQGFTVKK